MIDRDWIPTGSDVMFATKACDQIIYLVGRDIKRHFMIVGHPEDPFPITWYGNLGLMALSTSDQGFCTRKAPEKIGLNG